MSAESTEAEELPRRSKARVWILFVLLALVLSLAAAGIGAWFWLDAAVHHRGEGPEVELEVPRGASKRRVGALLAGEGLVDPLVVRVWLFSNPDAPGPKAGRHALSPSMNLPEMFEALASNPIPEDVPVTLVEGWRLRDADAFLAEAGRIEAGQYLQATSSTAGYTLSFPVEGATLAGYLLPDTYMVPPGNIEPRALVQRQLDAFAERFYAPHRAELEASGRTLRQVVIMASLLEREEPEPEVRPEVAGVLYNRLDAREPLGVDATSRYTLDDWSDRRAFLRMLRDPKDPWNTRLKAGLPPGPIGAPSLPSLLAALRPKKTSNWYYLHDKSQQIHFSKNAREHEAKRRKYDVW